MSQVALCVRVEWTWAVPATLATLCCVVSIARWGREEGWL
jgi:hypothetical protein